jgi:hypothetical protein
MNLFLVILVKSVLWILFSQLNELRNANDGCCKTQSCGKSGFDKFLWNGTLIAAIIFTLLFIYRLYLIYTPTGRLISSSSNFVNAATEMMFGK